MNLHNCLLLILYFWQLAVASRSFLPLKSRGEWEKLRVKLNAGLLLMKLSRRTYKKLLWRCCWIRHWLDCKMLIGFEAICRPMKMIMSSSSMMIHWSCNFNILNVNISSPLIHPSLSFPSSLDKTRSCRRPQNFFSVVGSSLVLIYNFFSLPLN